MTSGMDPPTRALSFTYPIETLRARFLRFYWNAALPGNLDTAPHVDPSTYPSVEFLKTAIQINATTNVRRFKPVGHCIYCGATGYEVGSKRRLGDEHIVAEGLGGDLILPEASCRACEAKTSRIEWIIVRRLFLVPRRRLGLTGKKRKRPDAKITLTTIVDGRDVEIELPLGDHPTLLMLPIFGWPGLVVARPISIPGFVGFWGQQLVDVKELAFQRRRPPQSTLLVCVR